MSIASFIVALVALYLQCLARQPNRWLSCVVAALLLAITAVSMYAEGWRWLLVPQWLLALGLTWLLLRGRQWPRRTWAFAIGAFVCYCTLNVAQLRTPELELPALTGPYPVAKHQWAVKSQRRDAHNPDPFAKREFLVNVYYPTLTNDRSQRAPYLSRAMMSAHLARDQSPLVRFFFESEVSKMRSQAWQGFGSGLSPALAHYPVVIFSPGYGWFADMHSFYLEQLASHGYVVFAITHPGQTPVVEYPDGRQSRWGWSNDSFAEPKAVFDERRARTQALRAAIEQGMRDDHRLPSEQQLREFVSVQGSSPLSVVRFAPLAERKADVIELLDRLESLNTGTPASEFAGRLDFEHIAIMGMSYGGPTSSDVCLEDARCKAVINMDGTEYGRLPLEPNTTPALWLYDPKSYEKDFRRQVAYERYAGPAYRVGFSGASHNTFADYPFWPAALDAPGMLWPSGKRARERELAPIVLTYLLDFLDHYLKNEPLQLLNRPRDEAGILVERNER